MADEQDKIMGAVKSSARHLIRRFESRAEDLRRSSDTLRQLIKGGFIAERALQAAEALFGGCETGFVAVDGTAAQDRELDMIIFYAGAYAYQGLFRISPDGCNIADLSEGVTSASVFSAIPIYEEQEAVVAGEETEGGIEVEPTRLPTALMHLSEYYLSLKVLEANPKVKIVILDRTLAGDFGHIIWSAREWLDTGRSSLIGMETPYGEVTKSDLDLARMLIPNGDLSLPPLRSQFTRYAIAYRLIKNGGKIREDELLDSSPLVGKGLGRIRRELERLRTDYGFFEDGDGCRIKPGAELYWERAYHAARKMADHIFNTPEGMHPLIIEAKGGERWIRSGDLELATLFMIIRLLRAAWQSGILPIGMIKDTMACDLTRTVVPLLRLTGKIGGDGRIPDFNSDKAVLQTFSVIDAKSLRAPWRTIEYDACFRTAIPEVDPVLKGGEVRVRGAHKNVISNERTFVKAYVQLWQSENDPALRSHVFAYDRPIYPFLDGFGQISLRHRDGESDYLILPSIEVDRGSPVSDLVMAVICSMANEVIPEALGHNYPLFLADKRAKTILEAARETYLSTVAYEMARSRLDQQILFNTKFREFRAEIEGLRRGR